MDWLRDIAVVYRSRLSLLPAHGRLFLVSSELEICTGLQAG